MKRYLVLKGLIYCPDRGMNDKLGLFHTEEEAKQALKIHAVDQTEYDSEKEYWKYNWAHVYDIQEFKVVWDSEQVT